MPGMKNYKKLFYYLFTRFSSARKLLKKTQKYFILNIYFSKNVWFCPQTASKWTVWKLPPFLSLSTLLNLTFDLQLVICLHSIIIKKYNDRTQLNNSCNYTIINKLKSLIQIFSNVIDILYSVIRTTHRPNLTST